MAFDLTRLNRYTPDNANMDYIANGVVNSYAPVTSLNTTSVVIDASKKIEGDHLQFTAGAEIFVHVSGSRNGTDKEFLGLWAFAEIKNVSGNTLTIDRNITGTIPTRIVPNYHVQAITVPFFNARDETNPVLNNIAPPAFDTTKMCGGILVLKCVKFYMGGSGTAVANHSFILTDRGIPTTHKTLRPWFAYELEGMKDTDPYAGWENAMLEHRLPLNVGDGAALIYAANAGSISYVDYIGSTLGGVRYCRGAADSPNLPANATNIGGSTAIIICRNRSGSTAIYHDMAAKYRSTSKEKGQGLGARLFVTKEFSSTHCNDGALYSHMIKHTELPAAFRLANLFGNGSFGNCSGSNATKQMNNYALITTTSTNATYNVKKIAYSKKTTAGLAKIEAGALVLVTIFNTNTWHTVGSVLCNVLADNGTYLTLDKNVNLGANRQAFVTSIPQFENFTLNGNNTATPAYANGVGGIFAIAVSGICDISAGKINATGKGGVPINISDPSLVERHDILTLGSGSGSILILANKIVMSTDTRLGMYGEYNHGNKLGGRGGNGTVSGSVANMSAGAKGGGYRGANAGSNIGGSGNAGGTGGHKGGYFASGTRDADIANTGSYAYQGAHLMIIADTISNFNINAISTGGLGWVSTHHGGAGYGGGGAGNGAGGGYRGGGAGDFASGGSAGYAFIWCNNADNQITDGIILAE